eukprot:TRINITY_DN8851_c0_g1_i1.p1 TRINITY_DN8851_c0_g1~~TRINITY_DN8851_c0_g1_i1.p1  ORF type:complete len:468 (-),score=87.09 TRINITY_DN8851_c0_g1_i1:38-1417(-)
MSWTNAEYQEVQKVNYDQAESLTRDESIYVPQNQVFEKSSVRLSDQYFHVYKDRLDRLLPLVLDNAADYWDQHHQGPFRYYESAMEAKEDEICVVAGVLWKKMSLQPDVLKEYSEKRAILPLPKKSFTKEDDSLYIEDVLGSKLAICGLDYDEIKLYCSGVIVAVLGRRVYKEFEAHKIFVPGFPEQIPRTINMEENDKYIVLVSGLNIGRKDVNSLPLELFVDYVCGNAGGSDDHLFQKMICRVIIAGNSLCKEDEQSLRNQTMRFTRKEKSEIADSCKIFDQLLTTLVQSVDVDLMPGENDPAGYLLPQKPLNQWLCRNASSYTSLNRVTNPHKFILDDIEFLGQSGELLNSLLRYVDTSSKLELMENTLKWRHLAPIAPSGTSSVPSDIDPFILESIPHVYFVGNQAEFDTKVFTAESGESVRIILVPDFSETNCAVIVNLNSEDLQCHTLKFSAL